MDKNSITISEELIVLNIRNAEKKDVLKLLSDRLVSKDYVEENFYEQIIKREKDFPTGIGFENIAIAIPHADTQFVKKSAICIGVCDGGVLFKSMENPEDTLKVEIIIVLAFNNPGQHLSVMSKLLTVFRDDKKIEQIKNSKSKAEIKELFSGFLG